jgi:DOPA 4,5-dioxygenase
MGLAGPHPIPQVQVIFHKDAFTDILPWLMFNRRGLDILVHPTQRTRSGWGSR